MKDESYFDYQDVDDASKLIVTRLRDGNWEFYATNSVTGGSFGVVYISEADAKSLAEEILKHV